MSVQALLDRSFIKSLGNGPAGADEFVNGPAAGRSPIRFICNDIMTGVVSPYRMTYLAPICGLEHPPHPKFVLAGRYLSRYFKRRKENQQ
jgi:hypothetical protein